jgi:heat shock protein HslJ
MKITRTRNLMVAVLFCALVFTSTIARAADPLPSWNDGATKKSIVTFVEKVTKKGSPDFVPVAERIATFDNDGTLWAEKPLPFQLFFALDRVKALAPQHPEWKTTEPFASLLKGDLKGALAGGKQALLEIMMAAHSGMTTEEFDKIVKDWVATAKHPVTKRPYTEMVYQPMLELLAYLRANGFKTFIVSGGGNEFMRAFAEQVYGVPPEQVVGSSGKLKFELVDGKPVLFKLPAIDFVDDKDGKPIGIQTQIGRRPIAAFGNSDGDLQMLQWTGAGSGVRFCLYVHHTDAEREYEYDRTDSLAKLDKGLGEAVQRGWTVVDMKKDWKTIFAVAMASNARGGSADLAGTSWLVKDIADIGVTSNAQSTLSFDKSECASGSTACNNFNGTVAIANGEIKFGPFATTRKACEPAVMDQEHRFLAAMDSVRGYLIDTDGLLQLKGANGESLMRLSRIERK